MKEFVLIFDECKVSCFENLEENYQILRIKGEAFYEFSDFTSIIVFLNEYLKNSIGIASFNEIHLIISLHKNYIHYKQNIVENFNADKIVFINSELINEYNKQLNDINGPVVAELKLENEVLEKKLNLLKNENTDLTQKIEKMLTELKEKENENNRLKSQVDFIYDYLNKNSEVKREIIYDTRENLSWMSILIDQHKIVTHGTYVLKGQKIFGDSEYRIVSPMEGYLYWIGNEIVMKNKDGNNAIAVITNQKGEALQAILKEIKNDPQKYKISIN